MDIELQVVNGSKSEQYQYILPIIRQLFDSETDSLAKLSNMIALVHHQFNWFWTGIYIVRNTSLVLGPFQGPLACTRIQKGKGVCGTAWQKAATIIVPDVNQFPGHIACNSAAQSEIVVPIMHDGQVVGVLDVDSDQPAQFDGIDQKYLEQIVALINFSLPA